MENKDIDLKKIEETITAIKVIRKSYCRRLIYGCRTHGFAKTNLAYNTVLEEVIHELNPAELEILADRLHIMDRNQIATIIMNTTFRKIYCYFEDVSLYEIEQRKKAKAKDIKQIDKELT